MTIAVTRSVRTWLRIPAATACLVFFAATIARGAPIPAGAITFVGTDSNIYYCDTKCAQPKCITCKAPAMRVRRDDGIVRVADDDSQQRIQGLPGEGPGEGPGESPGERPANSTEYGLPTFSPDGKRIAYWSESHKDAENAFALWVYDLARQQATQIFESRSERVVYLTWLSDGQHLSFLLGEPRGLSLMLAEIKESSRVRSVTTGMPLDFDWGATAGELAVHTLALNSDRTEQVSLMSLTATSQNVEKVLSSGRTPFKTPCWSPDRKHLAYIANYHAESNIVVAEANAKNPRSIVSLPVGENTFISAPDSAHLSYSTALTPQHPPFPAIKLVDVANANSKWLTKNDVAAFFFAPDSRHLAYIGVPGADPVYSCAGVDIR